MRDSRRRRWRERATVVGLNGPRSYDVRCEDGRHIRRNRQQLLATREAFHRRADIAQMPTPQVTPTTPVTLTTPVTSTMQTTPVTPTTPVTSTTQTTQVMPTTLIEAPSVDDAVGRTDECLTPVLQRSERIRKAQVRMDL